MLPYNHYKELSTKDISNLINTYKIVIISIQESIPKTFQQSIDLNKLINLYKSNLMGLYELLTTEII